jgi:hypothetical protein
VYVSYKVKCPTKATVPNLFVQDGFESGSFTPIKPSRLLVPAFPGPANNDHIECFKTKEISYDAPAPYTMDLIAGVGGFTDETGCTIVIAKAKEICIQATKQNVTPAPPGGGPGPGSGSGETFVGYKLTCPATTPAQISVVDQFGSGTFTPSKSRTLLVPAQ